MKKLKTLFALLVLSFFTIGQVWGETLSLTNNTIKSNASGKGSYGAYTIGDNWGGRWMISNNSGTYYLQLGYNTNSSKSAYNSHLAITMPSGASNISIQIETNNGTVSGRTFYACNANDKGYVNSGSGDYGSGATASANGTATISITGTPSVVYIYPNGTAYLNAVTVTYDVSSNPSLSWNPTSWDFESVLTTASASKTFKLSGSNLSAGTLRLSVPSGFTVDPAEINVSAGTLAATDVTVSKNTTTANTYSGNLSVYGGGIAQENAVTASLNMEVTAPTDPTITFNNGEVEVNSTLDLSTLFTSNSSGTVTYSITDAGTTNATLALDGKSFSATAVGTATVQASQAAAGIYNSATRTCTITVIAALPKVTFNATVDAGDSPLDKGPITMSCSNGVLDNKSEYRLYKNSTTTFECQDGYTIKKIEFIGKSGNPASGFEAPEVGSWSTNGNNGTWTGTATSVSFVASGAQVRATEIAVSFVAPKREVAVDGAIANGSVSVTGAADLSAVEVGTELTLSNTPSDGYVLAAYNVYKTGTPATTVTVTNNKFDMPNYDVTVSATFSAIDYTVTHNASTNGSYTIKVGDAEAVSTNTTANYGQTITLAATPATGYEFSGWTVMNGETPVSVTNNQFTMPAGNVTVSANFSAIQYAVTLAAGTSATAAGAATVDFNATALTITTATTGTGALIGYYLTSTSEGTKVANADGSLVAGDVDGYVTDGKWSRLSGATLYAVYDPNATGVDNTEASVKAVKVLREGQIFILRGDKVYTVQGQLVK